MIFGVCLLYNLFSVVEAKSKPRAVPSPHLQVGWEKRLDPRTNRYYYINHNDNTTQWEPPLIQGRL